jgi:hypothetical protein
MKGGGNAARAIAQRQEQQRKARLARGETEEIDVVLSAEDTPREELDLSDLNCVSRVFIYYVLKTKW